MSGITGVIGSSVLRPETAEQIEAMVRPIVQGSAETTFAGNVRNVPLAGHVAWTHREYEPMCVGWNDRRDICLVFSGEDFDVRKKITALGPHMGRRLTDVEVLVSWFERLGPKFVTDLNGRFCGVMFDFRNETISLFNDRYGLNRVYIYNSADGLYFSSEAKSLLAVFPKLRELDQKGLAEFFSVGCPLQNRSVFKNVSLLPPASWWTFHRDGKMEKRQYFDPRTWEQQEPLAGDEYNRRLTEVFGRIIPKYLGGNTPVAMSLTGGLDSRMILAWARTVPGSLPCYTFGGPYRDCADVRIARRLAAVAHQPHTTLRISPDFFENFTALAEKTVFATDGSMDVSGAVELYVNRLARQIAPVRLTGNYGSEILRSNVAFRPAQLDTRLFTPDFRQLLAEAALTYHDEAQGHRLSFIAFKQVPWHHYGRFAAERSQLNPRSPFLDNELVALAFRAPPGLEGHADPLLQLVTEGNPAFDAVDTDRALRTQPIPILGRLHRTWREFTAKAEYSYDYGMPRWLVSADRLLRPFQLEKLFLGRHKFYHFRVWYRHQLADALRTQFNLRDQPSCYIAGAAQHIVEQHTSGRANRTLELHKLLTVQLIERTLNFASCRN